jgi:hypothetical protein
MRRSWLIAICGVLLAPGSAYASGGPVQPVQGGAGVTSPVADGTVNYVALRTGRDTLVTRIRRADGAVERARTIRGQYGVPGAAYDGSTTGLSADGSTLVLSALERSSATDLLVLDPNTLRVRKRITRHDFLVPDAISPDGRKLYVLAYPKTTATYDVLALDLRTGRLDRTPIVDPREPDEKMGGFPLSRTMSADGRWAYTLYSGDENFVHALDTLKGEARCIDLPGGDFSGQPLRVDGTILRVGGAEKIDLRTFELAKAPVATATPAKRAPAGDDGGIPWVPLAMGLVALGVLVAIVRWGRRRSLPSTA